MAKATLRDDGDVPVLRAGPPVDLSAAQLVAEIARLYQTLPRTAAGSCWRPGPAYLATEAQIRMLARRHWALTSGTILRA